MSYQPCAGYGEPLPVPELKEVWHLVDTPQNKQFHYTLFAHKMDSFDTAPKKLLASDSHLRPDRFSSEIGDLSRAGTEKSSLEDSRSIKKGIEKPMTSSLSKYGLN